jgi:alpha-beta hydrolase superfamily lysophospholipase
VAFSRFGITSIDGTLLDAALHVPDGVTSRGVVIQAHGITADMTEGGMFVRLADPLASAGFSVVRFSFRGHGDSDGSQQGMTVAGEMLDLQAVVEYARASFSGPLTVVAASFGAVPTCLSLPWLEARLGRLVLWNPVLDLPGTFVVPELPWGLENFSATQQEQLVSQGFLVIDGEFKLGRVALPSVGCTDPWRVRFRR